MPKGANPIDRDQQASGKRYPLNMRTTYDVRRKLELRAAESGRSIAQEVEIRLERSFAEQESLLEVLSLAYGADLAGIILSVGEAMKNAGRSAAFFSSQARNSST